MAPKKYPLRASRDRLVNFLDISATYPIRDTEVIPAGLIEEESSNELVVSMVAYGDRETIILPDSQIGVEYVLLDQDGAQVGPVAQTIGGEATLQTGVLTEQFNEFHILARRKDEKPFLILKSKLKVKVGIDNKLAIDPEKVNVEYEDTFTLSVFDAQEELRFQLFNFADEALSDPVDTMTGGLVQITSYPVTEDLSIKIKVINLKNQLTGYLLRTVDVDVFPNPGLTWSNVSNPLDIDFNTLATLSLPNSQASTNYRLRIESIDDPAFAGISNQPTGVFTEGTGGTLTFKGGPLQEDSVLNILATKKDTQLTRVLDQRIPIRVKPNPTLLPWLKTDDVAYNHQSVVSIPNTQDETTYWLIGPDGKAVSAEISSGAGGLLDISTIPFKEDITVRAMARKEKTGLEVELTQDLFIPVQADLDIKVEVVDEFFVREDGTSIRVHGTQTTTEYSLYLNLKPGEEFSGLSPVASLIGTGGDIDLPTGPLTGVEYTFVVVATKINTRIALRLRQQPHVITGVRKEVPFSVHALELDFEDRVLLTLSGTQRISRYRLLDEQGKVLSDFVPSPQAGTYQITSYPLKEDFVLYVECENLTTSFAQLLTQSQLIRIRPNPAPLLRPKVAVYDYDTYARLVVENAQASTVYHVLLKYVDDINVDQQAVLNTVLGSGRPDEDGDLEIPIGKVTEDLQVQVRATKVDSGISLILDETGIVPVYPDAKRSLAPVLSPILSGEEEIIRIPDSQKGVFYQLRHKTSGDLIGTPRYNHKNIGVESAVIEIDMAIGTVSGNIIEVPTGPLTETTEFEIVATKATTRNSLTMDETALVEISS